jgi:transposase
MQLEEEWFRPAAYFLVKNRGMKGKEVAKLFGVDPSKVSRAITRFDETGNHQDRARSGRPKVRTAEVIEQVQEHLEQNNHTKLRNGVAGNSVRKLSQAMNINATTVWRIFRDDLGLKPWKKAKGQKLTEVAKKKRLNRAKELKERFANGSHQSILFSDEKYFLIEEGHNPQNDRIWSVDKPSDEERVVERQVKPKGVMVWAGVGYNAKAPLIFVTAGVKINTDVYREEILEPVEEWALEHYGTDNDGFWNNWTFQQDGHHHTQVSKKTQTSSRFQHKHGLLNTFLILLKGMSGHRHLLI